MSITLLVVIASATISLSCHHHRSKEYQHQEQQRISEHNERLMKNVSYAKAAVPQIYMGLITSIGHPKSRDDGDDCDELARVHKIRTCHA